MGGDARVSSGNLIRVGYPLDLLSHTAACSMRSPSVALVSEISLPGGSALSETEGRQLAFAEIYPTTTKRRTCISP